jgi:hypothetical protein
MNLILRGNFTIETGRLVGFPAGTTNATKVYFTGKLIHTGAAYAFNCINACTIVLENASFEGISGLFSFNATTISGIVLITSNVQYSYASPAGQNVVSPASVTSGTYAIVCLGTFRTNAALAIPGYITLDYDTDLTAPIGASPLDVVLAIGNFSGTNNLRMKDGNKIHTLLGDDVLKGDLISIRNGGGFPTSYGFIEVSAAVTGNSQIDSQRRATIRGLGSMDLFAKGEQAYVFLNSNNGQTGSNVKSRRLFVQTESRTTDSESYAQLFYRAIGQSGSDGQSIEIRFPALNPNANYSLPENSKLIIVPFKNGVLVVDSDLASYVQTVNSIGPTAGDVALTTDDVPEGIANLYFTDLRARTAAVGTGTVFPLLPDDWQQFRRTDLNDEIFEWDPVRLKWLSVTTYTYEMGSSSASAGNLTLTSNYNAGGAGAPVNDDMTVIRWNYGSETNATLTVELETVGSGGSIIDSEVLTAQSQFNLNNLNYNVSAGLKIRVNQSGASVNATRPTSTIFFKRRAT